MKALILVGGYGTRLRPLTLSYPKPIVPLANKYIVLHQIEALVKVGVKKVILAVSYKSEEMTIALQPYEEILDIKIEYSLEKEAMGTAGPIALAKKHLEDDDSSKNEPFFVLNSDITSEFPFDDLLKFHKSHGKEGTIMVTTVDEPSKYGVVVYEPKTGKIDRFVEKPQEFVGNKINAGIYIFNTSILNRIPLKPTSIEKEIFPFMAEDGDLYAMELKGFWMDVGQPKDYLSGMSKLLSSMKNKNLIELSREENIVGPVLIDPTAVIGKNCKIGPYVTIGPNCVIEDGVRLKRCAIFGGSTVKENSLIDSSIIGWKSSIGKWTRIENGTVLGMDVSVGDEIYLNGAIVLPHKSINESVISQGKIIM